MKPSENVTPISPLRVEQKTEVNPTVPVPGEDVTPAPTPRSDLEAVAELAEAHAQIVREIEKRIIGQRRVIDQLLVALFARGHTLFVGVPGLAKTLLISTLAETLNLSPSTVGTHLYHVKQKLGASNQSELTLVALRWGLIQA